MGGVSVAYHHARGLAARGHEVTVAVPRRGAGLRGVVVSTAAWARNRTHGVGTDVPYTETGVRTVEPLTWRGLEDWDHDAVIAIGHQSLGAVIQLSQRRGSLGISFVQDGLRHRLPGGGLSWHAPLLQVAVSGWVAEAIEAAGGRVAALVPNAVDDRVFGVRTPLEAREERVIALYHRSPLKGPDTLIESLERLRREVPSVEAEVVAARPPRHRLPEWVTVRVRPSPAEMAALYNRASVCLHTSRSEGWGLVPMEAAACGCAVVATESRGVNEYLRPAHSMLQVPVGDAGGVAREAARLLSDGAIRCRIAEAARADVKRFSWSESTRVLEGVLMDHAVPRR